MITILHGRYQFHHSLLHLLTNTPPTQARAGMICRAMTRRSSLRPLWNPSYMEHLPRPIRVQRHISEQAARPPQSHETSASSASPVHQPDHLKSPRSILWDRHRLPTLPKAAYIAQTIGLKLTGSIRSAIPKNHACRNGCMGLPRRRSHCEPSLEKIVGCARVFGTPNQGVQEVRTVLPDWAGFQSGLPTTICHHKKMFQKYAFLQPNHFMHLYY